jgi:glycosyltransferase involved in cell wall biosynthesis
LLRRLRVDVINTHSPVPFLADAAVIAAGRRPIVQTYHSGSMAKGRQPIDALIGFYERVALPRLFDRASAVVSVSPASMAHGHPRARQVTPGVDVDVFKPARHARPRLSILYVGRIERSSAWKGISILVEAFARVANVRPEARLVLAGGGDAVEDYRDQARHLGLCDRVHFTGPLSHSELVQVYQTAAVAVLPSTTASESFGMCLVEAMACGTPVIGSDLGGIPYVIDDGVSGFLVPAGDPDSLAAACLRLLCDNELAARMGRAARRRAETMYAWPNRLEQYLAMFRAFAPQPRG